MLYFFESQYHDVTFFSLITNAKSKGLHHQYESCRTPQAPHIYRKITKNKNLTISLFHLDYKVCNILVFVVYLECKFYKKIENHGKPIKTWCFLHCSFFIPPPMYTASLQDDSSSWGWAPPSTPQVAKTRLQRTNAHGQEKKRFHRVFFLRNGLFISTSYNLHRAFDVQALNTAIFRLPMNLLRSKSVATKLEIHCLFEMLLSLSDVCWMRTASLVAWILRRIDHG